MVIAQNPVVAAAATRKPVFAFVLQPEFPMNAFILATEALRIANQNSGQDLFEWTLVSETGKSVRASNGMWVAAQHGLADFPRSDFLVLLEGNLPTQNISPAMLAALRFGLPPRFDDRRSRTPAHLRSRRGPRRQPRARRALGGASSYLEHYPEAEIRNQIYLVDRQLAFCAGGVAVLDLMLDLIGGLRGTVLAREVANALIHTPRDGTHVQRTDDEMAGEAKPPLSRRIAALMEGNLDFPLPSKALARQLGISVRTLERYCLRQFNQTPTQLYLRVRLQAARNLLFYEEREIKDIAVACGFSYPSVFTRTFKAQFGQSPRAFRRSFRDRQGNIVRPEIVRMSEVTRKR